MNQDTPDLCEWIQDGDPDSDTWATDCGNWFVWIEGTPTENGARFCMYCGKPLRSVPLTWEDDQ